MPSTLRDQLLADFRRRATLPAALTEDDGVRLLAYTKASADMTVWTIVAAIALRTVAERAAGIVDLTEYCKTGFRDDVAATGVALPQPARQQYALGVVALGSNAVLRMRLRRVLERTPGGTIMGDGGMALALDVETDLLDVFHTLQEAALAALGLPPLAPGSLRAAVTDAFGRLPSSYLLRSDAFAEAHADMGLIDV